jgi:hypothetical protein
MERIGHADEPVVVEVGAHEFPVHGFEPRQLEDRPP